MSKSEFIRERLSDENPEAMLADGFEDALVGIVRRCSQPSLAAYDYDICISILVERDEMEHEDAVEYFEYNTAGAWVGENTPVFIETYSDES